MKFRIKQYWFNVKNSLWFLPTLMALSAVILALCLIELDNHISYDNFPVPWFIYRGQQEGARSVLSAIASSMVTIAGVTFSITLVALTMASTQFGPRLLRNFISDKANQFVIGTFISTFIYSLIVLLTIRGSGDQEFIPKISVIFAFLFAVLSLGVFIFFIHHVTKSIQADYIIKSSYNDFKKITNTYLLHESEIVDQPNYSALLTQVKETHVLSTEVCFDSSGYVQSVDYERASKWAEKNGAVIEWLIYPGFFATVYQPFAVVYHHSSLPQIAEQQLPGLVVKAYQRTPNQDILFSLKQIVEVGVRALSPGTNDPHTAITCIQWIGAALSQLSKKKFDSPAVIDRNGYIRVIKKQITYQDIIDTCFDQLRLYAKSNVYVVIEMLDAIKMPLRITKDKEQGSVLQGKAADIYHETIQDCDDQKKEKIEKSYREILEWRPQVAFLKI